MSSEENYLDNLLNNVLEPKPTEPMKEIQVSDIETVTEPRQRRMPNLPYKMNKTSSTYQRSRN